MTDQISEVAERPLPPSRPPGGPSLPDVWVYNGRAYDLTEWIAKHPGGPFFIGRSKNRDITSLVNASHVAPEKIEKLLERYALDRPAVPEDVHPKNNAPAFLFTPDFNSWRDTPRYRFSDREDLLHRLKARLKEPALAARVRRADRVFNLVAALVLLGYFAVQGLWLARPGALAAAGWYALPVFVLAMVALRSALAGYGHYAIHRAQRGPTRLLANAFDMNYVALTLVTIDGHIMLHHPHTQSEVDIKRNVFTMMMGLPRLLRIPVHTLHKFGHLIVGMPLRIVDVAWITRKVGVDEAYGGTRNAVAHFAGSALVRILLIGELVIFVATGNWLAWTLQFVVTLWVSTFLIVASHDFDEDVDIAPEKPSGPEQGPGLCDGEWAAHQIEKSYDLKVIGNRYVDCFLSAGLSSHRVHHALPFQRSGYANIACEDMVREEAAKSGIEWLPAKSFLTDRLPKLARGYLTTPSRQAQDRGWGVLREHVSPSAWKNGFDYAKAGFGIGTV